MKKVKKLKHTKYYVRYYIVKDTKLNNGWSHSDFGNTINALKDSYNEHNAPFEVFKVEKTDKFKIGGYQSLKMYCRRKVIKC